MKVAFFGGFIISLPVIFWQLWLFLAPGLYDHEKKLVVPFVFFATLMFLLGASFAYYIVVPAGIDILNKIELYGLEIDVLLLTRLEQFYDSTDIEKNDFQSIKKDIQNNKWKSCKNIIRFEDNLQVDWKKAINSFILE
jgi:hypothetical protein